MNGESLGDKREVLRREKRGFLIWREEEKKEKKEEELLEGNLKEKEEKWRFKLKRT